MHQWSPWQWLFFSRYQTHQGNICNTIKKIIMKQLDVDVSPPAFLWDPYLNLANVTFDLHPCDLWPRRPNKIWKIYKIHIFDMVTLNLDVWPWPSHDLNIINVHHHTKFGDPNPKGSWDMNYFPVNHWTNYCLVKSHFWHGDLKLWPMTLTFIHDLDNINVHRHTEFGDPNSNGSWDMNYCPVILV